MFSLSLSSGLQLLKPLPRFRRRPLVPALVKFNLPVVGGANRPDEVCAAPIQITKQISRVVVLRRRSSAKTFVALGGADELFDSTPQRTDQILLIAAEAEAAQAAVALCVGVPARKRKLWRRAHGLFRSNRFEELFWFTCRDKFLPLSVRPHVDHFIKDWKQNFDDEFFGVGDGVGVGVGDGVGVGVGDGDGVGVGVDDGVGVGVGVGVDDSVGDGVGDGVGDFFRLLQGLERAFALAFIRSTKQICLVWIAGQLSGIAQNPRNHPANSSIGIKLP